MPPSGCARLACKVVASKFKSDNAQHLDELILQKGDAMNVLLSACGQNLRKLLKRLSWAQIKMLLKRVLSWIFDELANQRKNEPLELV